MTPARWAPRLGLALGFACAEPLAPFTERQCQRGLEAAATFEPAPLMPLIRAIHDVRLTDPKRERWPADRCGHPAGCVYSRSATAALIRAYWSDPDVIGAGKLREQVSTEGDFETHNFLLDLAGKAQAEEWVIATAHYDAWFGGANDNASGAAVVLEVARTLSRARLERSVRLVLTDGEELGMVGSGRYLEANAIEGIVVVLNADSIAFRGGPAGTLEQAPAGTEYWLQANEVAAGEAFRMADLARRLPAPISLKPLIFPDSGFSLATVLSGGIYSDHAPFWLAGVPALFPFPVGAKPGWYHTPRDTPEQVDVDRLQRIGRLWAGALAAFATLAEPAP